MGEPLLQIQDLYKAFGAQPVLKGVNLTLDRGARLALLGSNGAGKSTLVKILAGDIQDWQGTIRFEGKLHRPQNPGEALRAGITLLYQELEILPDLSVAENIVLGPTLAHRLFSRRNALALARNALERVGADLPPDVPAGSLPPAAQQLVMLARAVLRRSKLLILDEPTALLTAPEIDRLFTVLDGFTEQGTAILYISHRIRELFRLGGPIAVLRDGILAGTVPPAPEKTAEIVQMMTGRTQDNTARQSGSAEPKEKTTPPVLEVCGLRNAALHDVSFSLRPGEVLGIGGLVGSGRSELLRAVAGLDPWDAGSVTVAGRALPPGDPAAALHAGLVLTPEDRKNEGLFLDFSLGRNVVIPGLAQLAIAGWAITANREYRGAAPVLREIGVTPPDPARPAASLSGGNQQKLLLARAVFAGAAVLLLDEPTRGIDVAGKEEVFHLVRTLAARGTAVVFVSSELEELARVAHRILVLHEGRVLTELPGTATEEEILRTVFQTASSPGV